VLHYRAGHRLRRHVTDTAAVQCTDHGTKGLTPQHFFLGAHGSIVGWGTMLQAWRSPIRVLDEVDFFNLPNLSSCTMAPGSIQPLTEMSTRNLPEGIKLLARRADNLATIWAECPKMWEPQSLASLRASAACTGITLPYTFSYGDFVRICNSTFASKYWWSTSKNYRRSCRNHAR
jgi:hypothetical protein